MEVQIDIAQRLRNVRLQHRFTQERIAENIGIKKSTYAAYEEGRAKPSLDTFLKLSEFYGFNSLDELLGIVKIKTGKTSPIDIAYNSTNEEKRKIVDFILNLNC